MSPLDKESARQQPSGVTFNLPRLTIFDAHSKVYMPLETLLSSIYTKGADIELQINDSLFTRAST